jgi:hypothetical protein
MSLLFVVFLSSVSLSLSSDDHMTTLGGKTAVTTLGGPQSTQRQLSGTLPAGSSSSSTAGFL